MKLGINLDFVGMMQAAGSDLSVVQAAVLVDNREVDSINIFFSFDAGYIKEDDVERIKKGINCSLNLIVPPSPELMKYILRVKPATCTLVSEDSTDYFNAQGLDLLLYKERVGEFVKNMRDGGIEPSVLIDTEPEYLKICHRVGIEEVRVKYSPVMLSDNRFFQYASKLGIKVIVGSGLKQDTINQVVNGAEIDGIDICHYFYSRSVREGIPDAVSSIKKLLI